MSRIQVLPDNRSSSSLLYQAADMAAPGKKVKPEAR
jgi:hypothetical protein